MAFEWFISFIVFLIIEALTVNLVTIWFAIGALASTISCLFTDSIIIQATVFVIVSVLSLFATQPLIRKIRKTSVIPTNFDRVIGKIGVVTKKIGLNDYGEVKIFGNYWTAYSKQEIKVGERVKILSVEGVKLIVEKEEK